MTNTHHGWTAQAGFVLTRIIVPLWVLAGALFKLYERNPLNLPSVILKTAKDAQWNLEFLLRGLIGLELFAVAVMVLIPRLSRAMAVFMLSSFCLILLGEMYRQSTKCGCFGSLPFKPWHMLAIDGSLLLAVLVTWLWGRGSRPSETQRTSPVSLLTPGLLMVPLLIVSLGVSFAVPEPPPQPQENQPVVDSQANPNPRALPNSWYTSSPGRQDEWIGKAWQDIDLFQFMRRWPRDLDNGKQYVIFYSRTCDHCEAMFLEHLTSPLDAPVAAVQIPSSKTVMTDPTAWEMPSNACELLELPLGCNWIMTPPLAITIVDGKVTCAIEGEGFEDCLGLQ